MLTDCWDTFVAIYLHTKRNIHICKKPEVAFGKKVEENQLRWAEYALMEL